MQSGVLTSIISSQRSAIIVVAHCPNERTMDSQSPARQTHLCPSQPHCGLTFIICNIIAIILQVQQCSNDYEGSPQSPVISYTLYLFPWLLHVYCMHYQHGVCLHLSDRLVELMPSYAGLTNVAFLKTCLHFKIIVA